MSKGNKPVAKSPQGDKSNSHSQLVATQFSGPLPPPSILRGYDDVCPGFAERIVKMAEDEGDHRRDLERQMVKSDIASAAAIPEEVRRGQIFAFLLSLAFLIAGTFLIYNGKQITGALVSAVGFLQSLQHF